MFPRLFRGAPVLYSSKYFWAEDYALWCSLSRLGRIACPAQVIYRYRRHALSITSRQKAEQDACAALIQQQSQSALLRSGISRETVAELSRFWLADGSRPLTESIRTLNAILEELRASFLAYVEQRYGLADRTRLDAELDKALGERFGYWLFRSLRFQHGNACRDLLTIARARREVMSVFASALALAAGAVKRRV